MDKKYAFGPDLTLESTEKTITEKYVKIGDGIEANVSDFISALERRKYQTVIRGITNDKHGRVWVDSLLSKLGIKTFPMDENKTRELLVLLYKIEF